jgi:hypothetical protein
MITLETLKTATEQEVFDQVARHLLIQNKQCLIGSECAYRSPDGLKCAAGCLIGDDEYKPYFESRPWDWLVGNGDTPNHHSFLIDRLQKVHDHCLPFQWKEQLQKVAINFGLEFRS